MPLVSLPLAGEVPLYQGDLDEDLKVVSRNLLAERITGGLSWPGKMPCPSWGISALRCQLGSVLAQKTGTICSSCYALKGHYTHRTVQDKLEARYRGLFHPLWTPSMAFLIRYFCDRYFRWLDSGDLQGAHHLRNICTVAVHTPDIRHWLPTREADTVRQVLQEVGPLPANLVVRVSAHRIDGPPPRGWPQTSTVTTGEPRPGSFRCPAPDQGNVCAKCRACWDPGVKDVAYTQH